MKIKNKLTLIFTVIVAVILVCLNLYIYFFTSSFTHNNFYSLLKDRTNIAATLFLEADEQNPKIIEQFQKKFLHALSDEVISVYNDDNLNSFTDSTENCNFDKQFIDNIRKYGESIKQEGDRQSLGIYYKDNQGNFVIIASAINQVGINSLNRLKLILVIGFILSVLTLFVAGRFFVKSMLRPITDISIQTNKISESNLHLRLIEGNNKDELGELSIVINRMLERLEHAFDLQKSFVANASHELRTPLTSIIGNIEITLNKARSVEEHKEVLESIMIEAERLHKLINGLLSLAQSNIDFTNLVKEEIRLDELLFELKDELHAKRPESKIEIVLPNMPENPSLLIILGDKNLLEIAFLNILDNACKFSKNKAVQAFLLLDPNTITIKIVDHGIGISKSELPHITETFFRANNARIFPGSGIGLTLAEKIILMHGGKFKIHSELHVGTEVIASFQRI